MALSLLKEQKALRNFKNTSDFTLFTAIKVVFKASMFATVCIEIPGSKPHSPSFYFFDATHSHNQQRRQTNNGWILIFILFVTKVRTLNNFPFPWGGASGGTWIGLIIRGGHTCTFINNSTQAELIRVFTPVVLFFVFFFFFFPASKGRRRAKVVNMRTV